MIKIYKDKIGVLPIREPEKIGSLYVPIRKEQDNISQGVVKYIGSECRLVQVGDHVVFSSYTGVTVSIGDEEIIVMEERFVDGVVERDDFLINGLFVKTADGKYVQATYGIAMKFITLDIQEKAEWMNHPQFRKIDYRPHWREYNAKTEE